MVVRTFEMTPGHTGRMGLDVGSSNVREYFPRRVDAVELVLDHLCIVCTLGAEFWEDRPEIHDLRLSLWLEAKRMGGKLTGTPAALAMIPSGQGVFRLEVIARDTVKSDAVGRDAADYALTGTTVSLAKQASASDALSIGSMPGISKGLAAVIAPLTSPGMAPVVAFDRRKRSIPHQPERRGPVN